jgi:hypothetical protein
MRNMMSWLKLYKNCFGLLGCIIAAGTILSCKALTACFVVQDLDHKNGHLRILENMDLCWFIEDRYFQACFPYAQQNWNSDYIVWVFVFKKNINLSASRELLERFHHITPEPIVNGEDPESFLISENRGHPYFFVTTKSGSASRQSQKRTIVEYGEAKVWKFKSCLKQNYFFSYTELINL